MAYLGYLIHGNHKLLEIPKDIDIVIHSGDSTNFRDIYKNQVEFKAFTDWYKSLDIPYKVLIAGNHDATLNKNIFNVKQELKDSGIIYLENESVEIEGLKIYGSPHTPTFGDWYFQKSRTKLHKVWEAIPEDTDILVTHGPPKGILDITENYDHFYERVGDSALFKRICKLNLKVVLFGHVHNCKDIINTGTLKLSIMNTIFSNGSVVTDGKFGKLTSNGNILKIKRK